ncbi:sulfite exporter TauE/SafE family protein [Heyndrickxia ginsengihumi]|uniref:sulfite exporter TauE/SafE family protein n=1 Tax=Heyndrickxia ginsengihumi TaxID=363870 RepID=UPI000470A92E|nr:sulfite exporter TauE/SafE family protein [Heyndrickxia ginsengihumi]MBE6184817.1 sulfite exporter TauE/SafE family protein [Bacillus sp. (in: firmicutes)]MCM3021850.1 sulfite exporter TauE/SafE family protein [Heyndrickxia ginsengihumi]
MQKLIILAFVGLIAQLVDGSLGMGYGLTSTSLLLAFGITPAVASASVHLAEVVTTGASGISHTRFGNVDKEIAWRLIIPGAIGAFLGATILSHLPANTLKPYISIFLMLLGLYVLFRFIIKNNQSKQKKRKKMTKAFFIPLGFIAGFFDATGGGGWGPIATPTLLSRDDIEPRKVIGSVDTSEFAVALASSIGFLLSLGAHQINWIWTIALMLGGMIAAPIAAYLVKILPSHLLAVFVSGMIIFTNIQTLLSLGKLPTVWNSIIYIVMFILWFSVFIFTIKKYRNTVVKKGQTSETMQIE